MDISLNSEIERLVTGQLQSGRFRSPVDVIQQAVRLLVETERLQASPMERRSPRGLLADIASHIDPEEIQEARNEMWASMAQREV